MATKVVLTREPQTPSNAMVALFSKPASMPKVVRRNMPAMIRPGDVPIGQGVSGQIVRVLDSPVTTIKGMLLWLKHESGQEFTFPVTGVIRQALCPGKAGEPANLKASLEKEVGKTFFANRMPDRQSSKYKKTMFIFDVFTSE